MNVCISMRVCFLLLLFGMNSNMMVDWLMIGLSTIQSKDRYSNVLVHAIESSSTANDDTAIKEEDCVISHDNRRRNYWSIEFCPEKLVRQFRVEVMQTTPGRDASGTGDVGDSSNINSNSLDDRRQQKSSEIRTQEIVVGRYNKNRNNIYDHGELCETRSSRRMHRTTVVEYICCSPGKYFTTSPLQTKHSPVNELRIHSFEETSLCNYKLTVCDPYQCKSASESNPNSDAEGNDRMKQQQQQQNANENIDDINNNDNIYRPVLRSLSSLLEDTKVMFYHGYDNYMKHAFPQDELRPVSCRGSDFSLTAGSMLTLIDSLDTLAILGNKTEFERAVKIVSKQFRMFDIDKTANVFETTIRVLGGLLSAHAIAVDPTNGFMVADYKNELLDLATDLANRLLPAFSTPTSIPYGTVHLQYGVPKGETSEACTAAAGSLFIEFGMLSIFTNDPSFGTAARASLKALFDLRSKRSLVGRHIDVKSGKWTEACSGIGSNIDSLFEYYLKSYMLFGDDEMWNMFRILYSAVLDNLREKDENTWYIEADMHSDRVIRRNFQSLQAFWPGLQALLGDTPAASRTLNAFYQVWNEFKGLPEDFDFDRWMPLRGGSHSSYPLRPELIESTYFAYLATRDKSWLYAGQDFLDTINKHMKTPCGYASLSDVISSSKLDTMPSYFLSETTKYLYLLFSEGLVHEEGRKDAGTILNNGNWIFSTEAHPFKITPHVHKVASNLFVPDPSLLKPMIPENKIMWGVPSLHPDHELTCPPGSELDYLVVDPYYNAFPSNDKRSEPYLKRRQSKLGSRAQSTSSTNQAVANEKESPSLAESLLKAAGDLLSSVTKKDSVTLSSPGIGSFTVTPYQSGFIAEQSESGDKVEVVNLDSNPVSIMVQPATELKSSHLFLERGSNYAFQCNGEFRFGTRLQMKKWQADHSTCPNIHAYDESFLLFSAATSHTCLAGSNLEDGSNNKESSSTSEEESDSYMHKVEFGCSAAYFGPKLEELFVQGGLSPTETVYADPPQGCGPMSYRIMIDGQLVSRVANKIVLVLRGQCMFEEKAKLAFEAGAVGVIVGLIDKGPIFIMSGTSTDEGISRALPTPHSFMVDFETGTFMSRLLQLSSNSGNGNLVGYTYIRITRPTGSFLRKGLKAWAVRDSDEARIFVYPGSMANWVARISRDPDTTTWQLSMIPLTH